MELLRQDSNLVQVSQSHRCCRYTTQDCAALARAPENTMPCLRSCLYRGGLPAKASPSSYDRWLPAVTVSDLPIASPTRRTATPGTMSDLDGLQLPPRSWFKARAEQVLLAVIIVVPLAALVAAIPLLW